MAKKGCPFVIVIAVAGLVLAFGTTVKSHLVYESVLHPDTFTSDEKESSYGRELPSRNTENSEADSQNPFDIDVITSNIRPHRPDQNFFFQHSVPFFGNHQFIPTFGNIDGNAGFAGGSFTPFNFFDSNKRRVPWWKGPNVCTERIEDEVDVEQIQKYENGEEEDNGSKLPSFAPGSVASFLGGFQININSCSERPHKYVCRNMFNKNGKKVTLTIKQQCCHGYGRSHQAGITGPCEALNLKTTNETAEELGAKEFMKIAYKNELYDKLLTNITIFLPIDKIYTEYTERMFENVNNNNLVNTPSNTNNNEEQDDENRHLFSSKHNEHSENSFTIKELTLNHIIDGWINMEDVKNEQLLNTNYDNNKIRINIFPKEPVTNKKNKNKNKNKNSNNNDDDDDDEYFVYSNVMERFKFTANCAPIIKMNQLSKNGVLHVIDRVLEPIQYTILDIIKKREDMTILRTIFEKTNMEELLNNTKKSLTLFAPTDKAFEKLEPNIRRILKEGKDCAINILKNHILDLTFCSIAVVDDAKTTTYNVLGEPLIFERIPLPQSTIPPATTETATENDPNNSDDSKKATEIADLIGDDNLDNYQNILINRQAKIIKNDIMATNGVLHIIDAVLLTETALPITALLKHKNLTIFEQLIEAANLEDQFNDFNNVAFFVPVDKAFENSEWKDKLLNHPEKLIENDELKDFLNYHIIEPMTKTCDLKEKFYNTRLDQAKLRVNLYATNPLFANVMNRATVNCARLMHFDDESCGTVLHQIDKILTPPKMNMVQTIESNKNYSKFMNLLKMSNLTHVLEKDNIPFTVLIPKNDVFEESEDWYNKLIENHDHIVELIQTHIVYDVICCASIIPTSFPFIRRVHTYSFAHLQLTRDRRPKFENAAITKCDIIATNGIIHEVNDIVQIRKRSHNKNQHHQPSYTLESLGDWLF